MSEAAGLAGFAAAVVAATAVIASVAASSIAARGFLVFSWNSSSNVDGAHATGRTYAAHS